MLTVAGLVPFTTIDYPARFCASNALKKSSSCSFISDILSDVFFMAKPNDMDLIMQTFESVRFEKYKDKMWTPESLITNILFKNGIATLPIFYFFNRDFDIIRVHSMQKKNEDVLFALSLLINYCGLIYSAA